MSVCCVITFQDFLIHQHINSTLLMWRFKVYYPGVTACVPSKSHHHHPKWGGGAAKVYNWAFNLLSLCVSPRPPSSKYRILMSELFYFTSWLKKHLAFFIKNLFSKLCETHQQADSWIKRERQRLWQWWQPPGKSGVHRDANMLW